MTRNLLSKIVSAAVALLLAVPASFAQTREISGTIVDESGTPVIGAAVFVSEIPELGAVSDENGNFVLALTSEQASKASTLNVSCLGMKSLTVQIPLGGGNVNITMETDTAFLEEAVAIGYGAVRHRDLTGSVASVSEKQFNKGVVTSVTDMIAGQIPGLVVTTAGGDPTTGATMRLRGTTSLMGGNSPLIVIDGVPDASLNLVSPEDVESISVLKDASAAAIYGARSANGVIIITTKKGREGKLSVSYNGYYAVETVANNLDMLSADQWREYVAENNIESAIDYGADTEWHKEMLRLGQSQSHGITLSGGTRHTSYRAGITYLDRKGLVRENDLRRFNANVSIEQKALKDKLKVSMTIFNTYEDWSDLSYDSNIWSYAYNLNPTMPVYNEDGSYFQPYTYLNYNPISELEQVTMDKSRNYSQGRLGIDYKILPFLSAGVSGTMSRNSFISGYYTPSTAETGRSNNGIATRTTDYNNMRLLEANVTFDKLFAEKHRLNAVVGYSWQKYINEGFNVANRDFVTDLFEYNNINVGMDLLPGDVGSYKNSSKLISFYGRVTYDYKGKYLVTATLRRDGSSKFGANHKWGTFPSASVAWRISDEGFMKSAEWLDDLKIRASYGVTGNQDIGNYKTMAIYGDAGYYYNNGEYNTQYSPIQNENPDLKWEQTAQLDLGVDFSFFNGRLRGAVDYYNKRTTDLLYEYPVPVPPYLYGTMMANVGVVTNKGFEISLNTIPVQTRNFRWDLGVNMAHNENMLVSLSNEQYSRDKIYLGSYSITGLAETTVIMESGHPIGTFYGAKYIGTDENGIFQYADINGDGKFVYADDRTYIGNPQPDFTLNITSQFQYKNFFASFLLRGVFGNDVVNGTALYLGDINRMPGENVLDIALDKAPQTPVYSSYYVEDGSFLRLDNLQVGYDFKFKPDSMVKNVRLTLNCNNLFIITKYTGIDPEVSQDGTVFGIDARNYYPKTRSFSLGLNITL